MVHIIPNRPKFPGVPKRIINKKFFDLLMQGKIPTDMDLIPSDKDMADILVAAHDVEDPVTTFSDPPFSPRVFQYSSLQLIWLVAFLQSLLHESPILMGWTDRPSPPGVYVFVVCDYLLDTLIMLSQKGYWITLLNFSLAIANLI